MPPAALRAALSDPETLPPGLNALPADHPALKSLRPLGYQVNRWLGAMTAVRARCAKNRLPPELLRFLADWMPEPIPAETPAMTFCLLLGRSGQRLRLHSATSASVAAPSWWALLQLPALRQFWISELRASHVAHLLATVPPAWLMDPAPLPPGSVIPGLELADWQQLPRWREQGRSFVMHRSNGSDVELSLRLASKDWLGHIESALAARDAVLTEETEAEEWLLARYRHQDKEITLADAFSSISR